MHKEEFILIAHGGGGKYTRDLIKDYFLPAFSNPALEVLGDSALVKIGEHSLAITTDTFVVKPLFFPGGDIGSLAISGTVNDLAVSGAEVKALSVGFVIEEGFPLKDLQKILDSMKKTSQKAKSIVVTGDTKVVEKGGADGIFINTTGIGVIRQDLFTPNPIKHKDKIIINGTLGDHGIAVLSAREELPIESPVLSDAMPLNNFIFSLLNKFPQRVKFMRDATRGGFATVLNELVDGKNFGVKIFEEKIPVKESVKAVGEILGLDPLYLANEGKVVFVVEEEVADEFLNYMKSLPEGKDGEIVGEISEEIPEKVLLETKIGGGRILDMLIGDQLPRIC